MHVRQVIEGALLGLSQVELQALTLQTDSGWDWLEAQETGAIPIDTEAIVDELFSTLSTIAADWEDDALGRYMSPGSDDFDDYLDDDEEEEPDATDESDADEPAPSSR